MTDNEIKSNLEWLKTVGDRIHSVTIGKEFIPTVIDYINRLEAKCEELQGIIVKYNSNLAKQVAENERLKKGWKADAIRWIIADAKAEAYKEFADRLHEELRMYGIKDKFNKSVFLNIADKVKKEMVGEDK